MTMPLWLAIILLLVFAVLALIAVKRVRARVGNSVEEERLSATTDSYGTVFELFRLPHRAADHSSADAVVCLPHDFDASAPIHLVVFNHGFYTDVKAAYSEFNLAEQMKNAPRNSVLFLPEWQRSPRAQSSDQGRFGESGMFDGMVQDAFDRIDALKGKTLADIGAVTLLSHSAGYNPAESQLYNNTIAERVKNVVLLDALYDRTGFDRWLKNNARAIGSGQKRFHNIFNGTAAYSKQQAQMLKRELQAAGQLPSAVFEDYDDGQLVLDSSAFSQNAVVFKFSSATVSGLHPHFAIVNLYVAPVVSALKT